MTDDAVHALLPTPPQPLPRAARVGVVGSGWRSEFFLRMARAMPDRARVTGVVTRTRERGDEVSAAWGVPAVRSIAELLALEPPDYVLVAVPWDVTPDATRELVRADVPVLAETPPAPDLDGLHRLWDDVGASGLVQVAEHSPFMPMHVARQTVLRGGAIGQVTQVQVSSTHMYHAVALIRMFLAVEHEPVEITARRVTAPLVDPLVKSGWTENPNAKDAGQTLAILDFGEGRSAVYDFTDNQWFNPLRANRLVVRGTHGELVDDVVRRWAGERTVLTSPLVRRQVGFEQDLEGFDLDQISFEGRVAYRNRFAGARLADDDLAVASLMEAMGAWTQGVGPPPYPLAQGSQDHAVALAVEDAARSGRVTRVEPGPWSA